MASTLVNHAADRVIERSRLHYTATKRLTAAKEESMLAKGELNIAEQNLRAARELLRVQIKKEASLHGTS